MLGNGGVPEQNSRDEPSGLENDFESFSAAVSISSLDEVAERVLSQGTMTPQEMHKKDEISEENLNHNQNAAQKPEFDSSFNETATEKKCLLTQPRVDDSESSPNPDPEFDSSSAKYTQQRRGQVVGARSEQDAGQGRLRTMAGEAPY